MMTSAVKVMIGLKAELNDKVMRDDDISCKSDDWP